MLTPLHQLVNGELSASCITLLSSKVHMMSCMLYRLPRHLWLSGELEPMSKPSLVSLDAAYVLIASLTAVWRIGTVRAIPVTIATSLSATLLLSSRRYSLHFAGTLDKLDVLWWLLSNLHCIHSQAIDVI